MERLAYTAKSLGAEIAALEKRLKLKRDENGNPLPLGALMGISRQIQTLRFQRAVLIGRKQEGKA